MRYVSLFSGIEAASVAWGPLGWEAVAFAEIEPFPCAVLAERFPNVPNIGDVTKIDWSEFLARYGAVDLVCGGSPCQSFSIAGGRESLDGESRLMFEYIRAVRELRPRWFVWENVPGVLNTRDDAFGCFLDQMDESGYSTAWRVLDAQFFGVAQRRRRVWAVGASRDAFGDLAAGRAAAVLFERESVRGNTVTSKQKREELARAAYKRSASGFKWHQGANAGSIGYEEEQSPTLVADWHNPAVLAFNDTQITNPKNGNNPQFGDACHTLSTTDRPPCIALQGDETTSLGIHGSGYQDDGSAYTLNCIDRHSVMCMATQQGGAEIAYDMCPTIMAAAGMSGNNQPVICIGSTQADASVDDELCATLDHGNNHPFICSGFIHNMGAKAGGIGYEVEQSPTITTENTPTVMCISSDSSNPSIEADICPTVTVAGSAPWIVGETVGALCARDFKGVGTQYVSEGKVVCQRKC